MIISNYNDNNSCYYTDILFCLYSWSALYFKAKSKVLFVWTESFTRRIDALSVFSATKIGHIRRTIGMSRYEYFSWIIGTFFAVLVIFNLIYCFYFYTVTLSYSYYINHLLDYRLTDICLVVLLSFRSILKLNN